MVTGLSPISLLSRYTNALLGSVLTVIDLVTQPEKVKIIATRNRKWKNRIVFIMTKFTL
jgi:hypothetical protein